MGRDPVSLGLSIFAFVLVCVIGVQFILNKEVLHFDLQSNKEGFLSSATSVASPTRAADCNCLPGYIASNTHKNAEGKNYFCQNLGDPTKTRSCY
jgi:hypothetical protein